MAESSIGGGSALACADALSPGGGAVGAAGWPAAGGAGEGVPAVAAPGGFDGEGGVWATGLVSGVWGLVCGVELQAAARTAETNSRFMVSPGRREGRHHSASAEVTRVESVRRGKPRDRVLLLRRERVDLLPAQVAHDERPVHSGVVDHGAAEPQRDGPHAGAEPLEPLAGKGDRGATVRAAPQLRPRPVRAGSLDPRVEE